MQLSAQNQIKEQLGERAASYIQNGMLVGLGTGSTANYFIASLIKRCREEKLKITAVCSSLRSKEQAEKGGIPLIDMEEVSSIDLTVDGADEVDPSFQLIKGGGGAHLREKILASASKQLLILVDETKLVQTLGKGKVPVEIIPFGLSSAILQIEKLGYQGCVRKNANGELYLTDNHNYLFDIYQEQGFSHPEKDHLKLIQIPAVVETGFFLNMASTLLVGYQNGTIEELKRR